MKIHSEDIWGLGQVLGFKALKGIYLKPGVPSIYPSLYENNYSPGGRRRAMLTEKALKETGVRGERYGAANVLNYCLEKFDCPDRMEFFDVLEMDDKLKGANMKDVQQQLRGMGLDFMISMDDVGSESFYLAHEPSIDFVDLCIGARHRNYIEPSEGEVGYKYKGSDYPFAQDSPSEKAVWSFAGGAMLTLHSNVESARRWKRGEDYPKKPFKDVRYIIDHKNGDVYIYGSEESKLLEKLGTRPRGLGRVL